MSGALPAAALILGVTTVAMVSSINPVNWIKGSSSDKGESTSKKGSSKDTAHPGKQQGSPSNRPRRASFGSEEKWQRPGNTPRYVLPETPRERYKRVAEKAVQAMVKDSYVYREEVTPLHLKYSIDGTMFFPEESDLTKWKKKPDVNTQSLTEASLSVLNVTTLDAARILSNSYRFQIYEGAPPKTGVLNFASATKAGGGFKNEPTHKRSR